MDVCAEVLLQLLTDNIAAVGVERQKPYSEKQATRGRGLTAFASPLKLLTPSVDGLPEICPCPLRELAYE